MAYTPTRVFIKEKNHCFLLIPITVFKCFIDMLINVLNITLSKQSKTILYNYFSYFIINISRNL